MKNFSKITRNQGHYNLGKSGEKCNQFTSEEFDYVIKVFDQKEQREPEKHFQTTTFNIQKWSLVRNPSTLVMK